jgi:Nicotinamide mononucleotide transporter
MQYYGVDWLATVCGLTGVYLLGNKNKLGFVLFMIASLSWVTFGVLTGSVAVMIGSSIFFIMHLRGWINWSRVQPETQNLQ